MAPLKVNDGGVNVPQVDHFRLLVAVLVQNGVSTDEEENADAHDEGPPDLQPVRVEIPAGGGSRASETPPTPPLKSKISSAEKRPDLIHSL